MTQQDERRVALEARVDPRAVARYLRGEITRRSTIEQIEAALQALGFGDAIRKAETA